MRSSIMKIWDLGKRDKRTGTPVLLRTAKVQPAGKPHPVRSVLVALFARTDYRGVGHYSRINLYPFFPLCWSCGWQCSFVSPFGPIPFINLLICFYPQASSHSRNCNRTCDVSSIHYCTCHIGFHGPVVISCRHGLFEPWLYSYFESPSCAFARHRYCFLYLCLSNPAKAF